MPPISVHTASPINASSNSFDTSTNPTSTTSDPSTAPTSTTSAPPPTQTLKDGLTPQTAPPPQQSSSSRYAPPSSTTTTRAPTSTRRTTCLCRIPSADRRATDICAATTATTHADDRTTCHKHKGRAARAAAWCCARSHISYTAYLFELTATAQSRRSTIFASELRPTHSNLNNIKPPTRLRPKPRRKRHDAATTSCARHGRISGTALRLLDYCKRFALK